MFVQKILFWKYLFAVGRLHCRKYEVGKATKGYRPILRPAEHDASVNITNLLGKIVLNKILNNKNNSIDISNVASGNYIITVTQNQVTKTEKLTITD